MNYQNTSQNKNRKLKGSISVINNESGFTLIDETRQRLVIGETRQRLVIGETRQRLVISKACKLPISMSSKNEKFQKSTTYKYSNGFTLRRTPLRGNLARGFTLIEVLIATALTLIVMGFVIGLQYVLSQAREVSIDNYYNVDTTNVTVNSITREIRTARLSETGTYPIESASDNQLIFFSDIDFDNRIERVRYTLTDETLEKGVIEPTGSPVQYDTDNETVKTVSETVQNGEEPLFTYYNGDWPIDTDNNPLATPPSLSDIKLIRIYLSVDTGQDSPYLLESTTAIRMLKDNL